MSSGDTTSSHSARPVEGGRINQGKALHVRIERDRRLGFVDVGYGVRLDFARQSTFDGGFTLIEILVVIVVIAVLASFVAPNVFTHVGEAKNVTARSQIEMLGAALDAYRLDNGRYPTTAQGLAALWQAPVQDPRPSNWKGPYLRKEVPLDPWGRPYTYTCPGEHDAAGYDLVSLGADGQPGGEGEASDIVSWK